MNISQLVRSLAGEARPGEQRSLELKTGQVVRATVTELSENGREAVVSVNGVPVRAVLDAPMQPGQTTWMQVQGQQSDGLVILKQTEGPSVGTLPSMEEALKQSGLPDEAWARRLLQDLQRAGLPLTKELAAKLSQAMASKPPGVAASEWMQAAGLALRRQLPLTADTLSGLRQALFGKPLTDMLAGFMRAGDESLVLGSGSLGSSGANTGNTSTLWTQPLREAQTLIRALLAEGLQTSGQQANGGAGAAASANGGATNAPSGQSSASPMPETLNRSTSGASMDSTSAVGRGVQNGEQVRSISLQNGNFGGNGASGTAGASGTSSSPQPMVQSGAWIGKVLQLLGVSHEQQAHRAAVMELTSQQPQQTVGENGQPAVGGGGSTAAASGNSSASGSSGLMGSGSGNTVPQFETPAQSAAATVHASALAADDAAADKASVMNGGTGRSAPSPSPEVMSNGAAAKAGTAVAPVVSGMAQLDMNHLTASATQQGAAVGESLKSALLQLLQADGVPHALREAAQQLVQHVTGQQLLLASDRQAPFSHITLFVPLVTPEGKQTAAVHIQSRQSKRGELDAGNCRLWFDLNMKVLGRTLVDVQVVDNAVALHIHHADERLGEWMDGLRDEAEEALEQIGYQLSAFRTLPLPEKHSDAASVPSPEISMDDYAAKPYKGVDMKI
ncbi:DNA ligase [Paenibacillus sp. NAIST15-1]|uniref:DNA ligase n=1 Tax=Paenibacillus sp. NAIST15-1 TaxID=1605994 RepID=UPI00086B6E3D|nr:DNA ligase [Paenibacillus sp. NAIST15-1]GAV12042.1 DNA ligase 1 [Paenibacillus sp. NAIST15-1]